MLKVREKISYTGTSVVGGVDVSRFTASIDSANPTDMTFTNSQLSKNAYKENRVQARKDQEEFEEFCYAKQEEMLAEMSEQAQEE